jgi:cytochrome c-type biogenesis protein CcmH
MRERIRNFFVAWLLAFTALNAAGAQPDEAVIERRAGEIAAELRCLVCQNQTLADSNASLAVDLKNEIKEMLRKNKTEEEIKAYMVERYGDFVLYRPPVKTTTLLLWAGPVIFLLAGLAAVVVVVRKRAAPTVQLSESEREAAARLLDSSEGKRT